MSLALLAVTLTPLVALVTAVVSVWATRRTARETSDTARDARAAAVQEARDKYELDLLNQGNAMRQEAVEEAKRLRAELAEMRAENEQLNRKVDEQADELLKLRRELKALRDRFDEVVKE